MIDETPNSVRSTRLFDAPAEEVDLEAVFRS